MRQADGHAISDGLCSLEVRMGASPASGASGGIEERLVDLHRSALPAIEAAADEHASELGTLIRLDIDIGHWADKISLRPESKLLHNARTEFGYAIYLAAS